MNRLLRFYLPLLCFTACSSEYTPPPQKETPRAVILGEIYQNTALTVTITSAKNTTIINQEIEKKINNVALLDSSHQKLSSLEKKKNSQWSTPFLTRVNTKYFLRFEFGKDIIEAITRIPTAFTAKIIKKEKRPNDCLQIILQIENKSSDNRFYTIECFRKQNKALHRVAFECKDTFSDNYKLHELSTPYNRLFITSSKTLQASLLLPLNEDYEIQIKNTTKQHYSYLYHYEVQLDNEDYYLPSSQNSYLGSWGGCYLVKLSD